MSRWNHFICSFCWQERNPDIAAHVVRAAAHVLRAAHIESEVCCFCGEPTDSGIIVRENPDRVPCKGAHRV
jgi:hypothetical protein